MNFETLKDYAPMISAIAATASAVAAVSAVTVACFSMNAQKRALNYTSEALNTQKRAHINSAFLDFVMKGYLDREFIATDAPKIKGVITPKLRQAKKTLFKGVMLDKWNERSRKEGTPENRVAYELSVALEQLGIAIFTGVMPIEYFLAIAADQVVDDWVLCYAWVMQLRDEQHVAGYEFPYHRRHAEWLVYLSAFWLDQTFPHLRSIKKFFSSVNTDIENARQLVADYSRREADLMPKDVRETVNMILGREVLVGH